jgi:hypothetical protein
MTQEVGSVGGRRRPVVENLTCCKCQLSVKEVLNESLVTSTQKVVNRTCRRGDPAAVHVWLLSG